MIATFAGSAAVKLPANRNQLTATRQANVPIVKTFAVTKSAARCLPQKEQLVICFSFSKTSKLRPLPGARTVLQGEFLTGGHGVLTLDEFIRLRDRGEREE